MTLLTPKEAGEYLKISVNTLASWRCKLRGPKFIKTGRVVKYSKEDLDAFLRRQTVTTHRK